MTVNSDFVHTRLDEMMSQLEKSWPKTFEGILKRNLFPDHDTYFIYTFTKWDFTGDRPKYNVWHQPRITMPDPFWGTVCRRVYPKEGKSTIVWCLPHKEGKNNYKPGKIFEDEFVWDCIQRKQCGALDVMVDLYNKNI